MALQSDTTIGPYRVTALIGEGGMDQVYQAPDTKLNRQVALKILPERSPPTYPIVMTRTQLRRCEVSPCPDTVAPQAHQPVVPS